MADIHPTKVGDDVMYSSTFLRNTGQFFGDNCFRRGTVTHVSGEICTVEWQDGTIARALYSNLVLSEKRHLELP